MTIIEALKDDNVGSVVRCGDKCLYWSSSNETWVVNQRKYGQRHQQVLLETVIEEAAVKELKT